MPDHLKEAATHARKLSVVLAARDEAIRAAFIAGHGLREIGRAVGMSPTGVRKIIDRE